MSDIQHADSEASEVVQETQVEMGEAQEAQASEVSQDCQDCQEVEMAQEEGTQSYQVLLVVKHRRDGTFGHTIIHSNKLIKVTMPIGTDKSDIHDFAKIQYLRTLPEESLDLYEHTFDACYSYPIF